MNRTHMYCTQGDSEWQGEHEVIDEKLTNAKPEEANSKQSTNVDAFPSAGHLDAGGAVDGDFSAA